MTLEQRIEALEKKVASFTLHREATEDLAEVMRKVALETIKNACRPGGLLCKKDEKAALNVTAFEIKSGSVNIDPVKISASESV